MSDFEIRDFALHNMSFKTYPKTGWDVYEIRVYWKGAYLTTVEADGLEVEMFRHKDNPDPDSLTYDEFEEKGMGMPTVKMETPLQRKTRQWKEGLKVDEVTRKEGWD